MAHGRGEQAVRALAPRLWPWSPERPNHDPGLSPIVGHRGAAGLAPENTLAGLRKAAELGLGWVEFDVKLAGCGLPVLMHDDTLARTTDGHGRVARTPYSAIARLDAGSWFASAFAGERVPRLEEAIACLGELGLAANVEIKPCKGREVVTGQVAARTLARHWPDHLPPPLISSFSAGALAAARAVAEQWPRGLLRGAHLPWRWPALMQALGCASLHLDHRLLGRRRVRTIKGRGVPLLAYTVNEPRRARTLWAWGVDGIITDRPDLLLAALPERSRAVA